ncbi:hypothetical protein CC85DRAFT_325729 [Cutaneotrichosporon oleaginosum]|uniref:Uncharacterized protein n=1 Tax=Cutaneotrichosporon oleaginosum TaxID=879819 RepID=A0A0J0XVW2_9TREE|nr:uncharacterized protein CC85DRAFT_325729 [Cutaneotrichosporon oleaginosum]KLT45206.1 hypothetical protein CC85DRAFT_325729 [Cutaneotrichosporon oleaginosum]TXT14958.1 hypothetical protein COLE_01151 [Cutaneotrichosporon oleaginosum]
MPDKQFASLVEARAYTFGEAKGLRTALALLRAESSFVETVLAHPVWAAILSNIAGKAKGLDVAASRMRCHCARPQHELCRCPAVSETGATKGSAVTGVTHIRSPSLMSARSGSSMSSKSSSSGSETDTSSSSGNSSSTARTHGRSDSASVRSNLSDDPMPGANGLAVKPVKVATTKGKGKSKDRTGKDAAQNGKGHAAMIVLGPERRIPLDVPIPYPGEAVVSQGDTNVSVSAGASIALGGSISAVGPSIAFKRNPGGEIVSVLGPRSDVKKNTASSAAIRPRTRSVLSSISVDLEDLEPYVRLPHDPLRATVVSVTPSVPSSPVAPKHPAIDPIMPDRTGTPVRSVPPTPTAGGFVTRPLPALGFPSLGHTARSPSLSPVSSKSERHKSSSSASPHASPVLVEELGQSTLPDEPHITAVPQDAGQGMFTRVVTHIVEEYFENKADKKPMPEETKIGGDYGPGYKAPGVPGSYVHPGYGNHPSPSAKPASLPGQTTQGPLATTAAPPASSLPAPLNYSPPLVSRPPMGAPTVSNSHLVQTSSLSPYSTALAHPLPPSRPTSSASTVDDEHLGDVLERLSYEEQQYIASLFSGNEDPSRVQPVLSDQAVAIVSRMTRFTVVEDFVEETEEEEAEGEVEEKTEKVKHKEKKKKKTNTNRKPKKERVPMAIPPAPVAAVVSAVAPTVASIVPPPAPAPGSARGSPSPLKWASPNLPPSPPALSPPVRAMTAGPSPHVPPHPHPPFPRASSTPPHSLPTPPQTAYPHPLHSRQHQHPHPHPEPPTHGHTHTHTHRPGCACRRPSVAMSVCSNHSVRSHHSVSPFGVNGAVHASPRVVHAVAHACTHGHGGSHQLCSCTM